MKEKHTKTPWVVKLVKTSSGRCFKVGSPSMVESSHGGICLYDDETSFNPMPHGEVEANAAHIVHCVNNFDRLASALDQSLTALKAALPHYKISAIMGDTEDHKTAQVIMDGMKAVNTALKDAGKEPKPC